MINKEFNYTVIGVSRNQDKYGYIVFRDLLDNGYKVTGVNPNTPEIDGEKIYPSLEDVNPKPDVVICVVPPEITEQVVQTCAKLEIKNIWMQPGSESEKAISLCKQYSIECIHNSCIMIERKN